MASKHLSISNLPPQLQPAEHPFSSWADILLTDREAAAELKCGLSTFRRWVAQGLVTKPLKLGGTSRWPRSEILAVIEAAKTRRDLAKGARQA